MLIDSHCHLNMIDLTEFDNKLDSVLNIATQEGVQHFLCVCVALEDYPRLCEIAEKYTHIHISVGIHPNHIVQQEPTTEQLACLACHPACIAIGETGLDYYRIENEGERQTQQQRFRTHIKAALEAKKPLVIHTRQAAEDTIAIMAEENADRIGGVMHCFSESWEVAKRAMDLNFYISCSGIVTFKNAESLRNVMKQIPLDRLLIETDSPYLAPAPFRGKQNHPALVKYVALSLSELRGCTFEDIASQTTANFMRCFNLSALS